MYVRGIPTLPHILRGYVLHNIHLLARLNEQNCFMKSCYNLKRSNNHQRKTTMIILRTFAKREKSFVFTFQNKCKVMMKQIELRKLEQVPLISQF